MDSLLLRTSAGGINLISSSRNVGGLNQNRNYGLVSRNGTSSLLSFSSLRRRPLQIVAAKKDSGKKKEDLHSFIPRPDEATGPFPEAVLLKEKKVEEDGRLLPDFADVEERELFESLMLDLESDLDVEQMRHYEVVYLIHEDRKDEVEIVNKKVQEFIKEKKGRIWRTSDWGMRRLAYKIQKAKNAHYILMNFEIEARWINDFKSMLDKDERVIRHLVMKKDQAETEDCPPPPEFHTMRADMDDNDEEYDDDYDDEDEDEDWDDTSEVSNDTENIFYIDEDTDDRETKLSQPANTRSQGSRKQKAEKVLH